MAELLTPDICVIGGGVAGITLAAAGARRGASVLLVEKGHMGGAALTVDAPARRLAALASLVAAAGEARALRILPAANGSLEEPGQAARGGEFGRALALARAASAAGDGNLSVERLVGLGVTVLRGAARFADRHTVVAGAATIRARHTVIATGATPLTPAIANLSSIPYLNEERLFSLTRKPLHLIVIGGSPFAIETAQTFLRLGSSVTVLGRGGVLPEHDSEAVAILIRALADARMNVVDGADPQRLAKRGRYGVRVSYTAPGGSGSVEGTHLFSAIGHRARVDDLGLAEAGVALSAGFVRVDRGGRTANPAVYALGAVTGVDARAMIEWDAERLAARLHPERSFARPRVGITSRTGRDPRCSVVFTDPEVAEVGLTDVERARRRHGSVRILRWPFAENERARAEASPPGFVKILTTTKGRVLGATLVGQRAGELIAPWAVAVAEGLAVEAVAAAPLPSATLAEAGRHAAASFRADRTQRTLFGRLAAVIPYLG